MTTEREELLRKLTKNFLWSHMNYVYHVNAGNIAISERFKITVDSDEETVYFHGFSDSEFKDMLLELEPNEEEL